MQDRVRIHEVALRDGLQNESTVVPTAAKVEFAHRLADAGYTDIEATSFVRPKWIPQLADAADVCARLPRIEGLTWWGLVPNQRGLDRAIGCGVQAVATFLSASETHNRKNLNRTSRESLVALREVIANARADGLRVRAYISTVFGCPYEGAVDPARTVMLAGELIAAGAHEVSLGDTTGMGDPKLVRRVLRALTDGGIPLEAVALHMHDTRGTALANILAGLEAGVRTFDTSVAGLGGCPYAPGASGNAATEDLVNMLHAMGYDTGLDLEAIAESGHFIEDVLGRELPGRYHLYHRGSSSRDRGAETA
ncbi:MAG: hydroxymethylglutaryl-CoA lyase [Proteobacteria bacterium]|nr:hydroxymethylglutaryl-CoA lyase [Pseudomonadota bacterium]MCP4919203.1 hydroxymethylglutaryl-CoA lyase [Pseudomonadota bacterium]